MIDKNLQALGLAVIDIETEALVQLKQHIDDKFVQACHYILQCTGRVVITGMGKSGHIGSKIAATMASTGTPSFFVHPGEASHGDLGMITPQDVVIALSNSGETQEILTILPLIKRQNVPLIALTGRPDSTLAKTASVNIDVSVQKEACPLGLAPTASTTAALAMGDALAIAVLDSRGFTEEDFALAHPGGSLGRRLLLRIEDIMHTGEAIPRVKPDDLLRNALLEVSNKGLGMSAVVDDNDHVLGIFTDGDLRRALDHELDIHRARVADVMTKDCLTISSQQLAAEALSLMEQNKISALLITTPDKQLLGALNMHDLLRAGVV
ncbi:MAG: KpsF/GutQ family sugar-phosphate isomerase [Gammaproteobacteria bacterium]|nr:KpsF/GutQ family sugar-phosphate isomerase [Gammaproteobacteria bacterium]